MMPYLGWTVYRALEHNMLSIYTLSREETRPIHESKDDLISACYY